MIKKLCRSKLFLLASAYLLLLLCLGIFAPLFASGKPLFVSYQGKLFFPLFRYLFFKGYFSKEIDLFFNAALVTSPLFLLSFFIRKKRASSLICLSTALTLLFGLYLLATFGFFKDPERSKSNQKALTFSKELTQLTDYEKLNRLIRYQQGFFQQRRLQKQIGEYEDKHQKRAPLLFALERLRKADEIQRLKKETSEKASAYESAKKQFPALVATYKPLLDEITLTKLALKESTASNYLKEEKLTFLEKEATEAQKHLKDLTSLISRQKKALLSLDYLEEKEHWLLTESQKLFVLSPFFRSFHWEEDAGGGELFNRYLPLTDLTRPNRKDLVASLLFGIRISLVVGLGATALSLLIGTPLGLICGYFGGKWDLMLFRFIEIWEAMPAFFMLLLITAVVQSKSIFLIIIVLALFSWTSFARYIRAETLKQRSQFYVLASKSMGFGHRKLIFSEILPNAIPPVLALLPFSIMAAISAEAGLAFLGLGEENSTSFGVLMSEARAYFPAESYLLWPPALFLTTLLIGFAIIGDSLRDALDPRAS